MRRLAPVVLAVVLTLSAAAAPATARTVEHRHEEDVLLVGHPGSRQRGSSLRGTDAGPVAGAGSVRTYAFTVASSDHRVELSVLYDPGPLLRPGTCTRATELDLALRGPEGLVRKLDGCDEGRLEIVEDGLEPGDYELRVWAEKGATVCTGIYDPPGSCDAGELHYVFDLRIVEL